MRTSAIPAAFPVCRPSGTPCPISPPRCAASARIPPWVAGRALVGNFLDATMRPEFEQGVFDPPVRGGGRGGPAHLQLHARRLRAHGAHRGSASAPHAHHRSHRRGAAPGVAARDHELEPFPGPARAGAVSQRGGEAVWCTAAVHPVLSVRRRVAVPGKALRRVRLRARHVGQRLHAAAAGRFPARRAFAAPWAHLCGKPGFPAPHGPAHVRREAPAPRAARRASC